MKFGLCQRVEYSAVIQSAGFDFTEDFIQPALQGTLPDDQWTWPERSKLAQIPVLAANSMLPGTMKVTGPDANLDTLRDYMTRVIARAGKSGIKSFVFGSGGARNIPDGFDRDRAREQIIEFLQMIAPLAKNAGVTIVVEPLNKQECNVINGVAEAMTFVNAIKHPNIQCLVDSFHSWTDDEPLADVEAAIQSIRHVHVADKDGRVPPGESGTADYRPLFGLLKRGGYKGVISVEALGVDETLIREKGRKISDYLRDQWEKA